MNVSRTRSTTPTSIRAALTAAKIHAAHRDNTDTLAGFDDGYDAGWTEAIEAAIITVNDHRNHHPVIAEIANKIADLKSPGD